MINSKFRNLGLSFCSIILYLATPTVTHAQTTSFNIPGLTFLNTSSSNNAETEQDILSTISFAKVETLFIYKEATSSNLSDLLVPEALAAESTQSAVISENESTASAVVEEESESQVSRVQSPESSEAIQTGPKETNKPTIKSTQLPKETLVVSTPKPTVTPQINNNNSGGLNADKLFDLVNNYRKSINLEPFKKDPRACELAESRAPEINAEIAGGHMHSGLRARNLPYWNSENIISMNSEQAAFNWWIHDQIHKDAIESDKIYSCVACSGNACAEEFTSFQAK